MCGGGGGGLAVLKPCPYMVVHQARPKEIKFLLVLLDIVSVVSEVNRMWTLHVLDNMN